MQSFRQNKIDTFDKIEQNILYLLCNACVIDKYNLHDNA